MNNNGRKKKIKTSNLISDADTHHHHVTSEVAAEPASPDSEHVLSMGEEETKDNDDKKSNFRVLDSDSDLDLDLDLDLDTDLDSDLDMDLHSDTDMQASHIDTGTILLKRQRPFPLPLLIAMCIFIILFSFQVCVSSGVGIAHLQNTFGAVMLVISAGTARFCDGFIQVAINKIVQQHFEVHEREAGALIVGFFGKIAVLIGAVLILPFVSFLKNNCSNGVVGRRNVLSSGCALCDNDLLNMFGPVFFYYS